MLGMFQKVEAAGHATQLEAQKRAREAEKVVRACLEMWVSELCPTILMDEDGKVVGLGIEGDLSSPPLVVVDVEDTKIHVHPHYTSCTVGPFFSHGPILYMGPRGGCPYCRADLSTSA